MKGLLHSKRFRNNLRQWLFMYVGVMALLTTVITYSKFISNIQLGDSSRAVKFNFDIKPVVCPINESAVCDVKKSSSCRPTQEIASCFAIDTTGLEIDSELMLSFYPALMKDSDLRNDVYYIDDIANNNGLKPRYEILGIDRIDNNTPIKIYSSDGQNMSETDIWTSESNDNRLRLMRTVLEKDSGRWIFRVRMKSDNGDNKSYLEQIPSSKIVKVGYSMSQITTKEGGNE